MCASPGGSLMAPLMKQLMLLLTHSQSRPVQGIEMIHQY